MKKVILVGFTILVFVLLVLGNQSNVVGRQTAIKITTPAESEGLKLLEVWLQWSSPDFGYWLVIKVQNNGTETIHSFHVDGKWNFVFSHMNPPSHDVFWDNQTWEPQQSREYYLFKFQGDPLPPPYLWPWFIHLKLQLSSDVPGYNKIIFDGKYRDYGDALVPLSGFWLWLANLIGR